MCTSWVARRQANDSDDSVRTLHYSVWSCPRVHGAGAHSTSFAPQLNRPSVGESRQTSRRSTMADKCVGMIQVLINAEGNQYALDNLRHTLDSMAIGNGKQFHTRRSDPSAARSCFDTSDLSAANRQASCYIGNL